MESWRQTWRRGIVPLLSRANLEALQQALLTRDPRLAQGYTTSPPPMQCTADWPVEAACVLGYMAACDLGGFKHEYLDGMIILSAREGAATVAEVEEAFGKLCFECDRLLGEPAGCRYFLNEYDSWTPAEMVANLLPEVELALKQRTPNEHPEV